MLEFPGLFRPILRSNTPTFEQLLTAMSSEPKTCTASASQLGAKFHACTESLGEIRHFLSTVANRGLKSKDHMKRILRGGRYHLTLVANRCDLKLTCGDTSKRSPLTTFEAVRQPVREEHSVYTLGELQDIRSRARLVLSTHKAQAKHFENIPAGMTRYCHNLKTAYKKSILIENLDRCSIHHVTSYLCANICLHQRKSVLGLQLIGHKGIAI